MITGRAAQPTSAHTGPGFEPGQTVRGSDRILARVWLLVVVAVWLILGAASITLSSMGVLAAEPGVETGVVVGDPKALRGDEFARLTPLLLGLGAVGNTDFVTPLTNDPFLTSAVPSGPDGQVVEAMLFPEHAVMAWAAWLPDGPLFALSFWFTAAAVVAVLPMVLVAFGVRFGIAAAATVLIALTPVVAWWSLRPLYAIFPGVIAVATWLFATRAQGRYRWLWIVLLGLLGGLALARIPWSYPPYSLPLSGAVVAIGLIYLGGYRTTARTLVVTVGTSLLTAAVATGLILLTNQSAYEALATTLYPGERRVSGEFIGLGLAFGAPFNGVLQFNDPVAGTNASEASSSWTFTVLLWLALVVAAWAQANRASRIRTALVGVVLAVGFSWFLIDWPPALGEAVPVLNLVQPWRLGQVWGLVVIIAVALVFRARPRLLLVVVTAAATMALLFAAGVGFDRQYVPSTETTGIVGITLTATAIVVLLMVNSRVARALGLLLAVVAAFLTVYWVNPVHRGLEPLRGSVVADQVVALAGDRDPASGYWATDSFWFGSLLAANGVPAVSGETWTGPSSEWRILDPTGRYERQWNRAVSKTLFRWEQGRDEPFIFAAQPDEINISIDPCSPLLDEFGVAFVTSVAPLSGLCLTERASGAWGGAPYVIYERAAVGR